jgi:hypothetical protein
MTLINILFVCTFLAFFSFSICMCSMYVNTWISNNQNGPIDSTPLSSVDEKGGRIP